METRTNQNHWNKRKGILKIIFALIGLLSYAIPYLLNYISESKDDFKFFDTFYAIGISLSLGGYLAVSSIQLKHLHHFISASVAVFFFGCALLFTLDNVFEMIYRTRHYMTFNLIISIICLVLLLCRKATSPRDFL